LSNALPAYTDYRMKHIFGVVPSLFPDNHILWLPRRVSLLLTAYCLLLTAYCSLLTVHYSLD
ncbi:MAG TPA: hypothetical protein VF177_15935, partial [Anaerolineae bacterium]